MYFHDSSSRKRERDPFSLWEDPKDPEGRSWDPQDLRFEV